MGLPPFEIPPSLAPYLGDAPRNARMNAARGMVPLPPRDLLTLLCCLSSDADGEVSAAAARTLGGGLPPQLLEGAVGGPLAPAVLDHLARVPSMPEGVLDRIALNRATDDETVEFLAALPRPRLAELISQNEARLLKTPAIARALLANPELPLAERERLKETLARHGISPDLPDPAAEARLPAERPAGEAAAELPAERLSSGAELPAERGEPPPAEAALLPAEAGAPLPAALDSIEVPEELTKEPERQLDETAKMNIYQRIQKMGASEKIKLALLGNKEARGILIRDSNKLVSTAVVRSPKVTEQEIGLIASSRQVAEDVLRIIGNSRTYMRNYAIRQTLVQNPKCPPQISMKLLQTLNERDVEGIAKSRGLPAALVTMAKRMIATKKQH